MPAARVAISASFTAEPLREPLEHLLRLLGWPAEIVFAPFAQVFQTLLDPQGLFARNRTGVNVVLVRAQDIPSVDEFAAALRSSAERHGGSLLVRVTPPDSEEFEGELRAALHLHSTVSVLTGSEQQALYPVREIHDAHAEQLGAIPYTNEYFAAVAAYVARSVHRLIQPEYKAVALDCDDTLWRGICGEDGPLGVVIDPPRFALQQFMAERRDEGLLLTMASKNNEQDVLDAFRAHPEMPLRLEHFSARRVDWSPKALHLQAVARELNLGLDGFIFLDDNPKEAEEVRAELPEVASVALPPHPGEISDFLRHIWAFDRKRAVTSEDQHRSRAYDEERRRAEWKRQAQTLSEFIARLELKLEFRPLAPEHFARASQLTFRTNQMNTTTVRRTEAEIEAFLRTGSGFVVYVTDRFGDYGLVGLVLFVEDGLTLRVDTFLLSCRALGRGVEHAMMRHAAEIARERGRSSVEVPFSATLRNSPAREFIHSIGPEPFVFPVQQLLELSYRPGHQPATYGSQNGSQTGAVKCRSNAAPDYTRIAQLRSPFDLLIATRTARNAEAVRSGANGPPEGELEQKLCAIWSDLLHVPSVGAEDNFFDLGGHSLLAVQLVARLRKDLEIDLPLEAVYTGTLTVTELARSIRLLESGQAEDPEYAALLAEIESLTDEEAQALLDREVSGGSER